MRGSASRSAARLQRSAWPTAAAWGCPQPWAVAAVGRHARLGALDAGGGRGAAGVGAVWRRRFFYQAMDRASHKLKAKFHGDGNKILVGTDALGNRPTPSPPPTLPPPLVPAGRGFDTGLCGAGYFEEEPAPDSYSELDGRKIRSVQPPEGMGDIEAASTFDTNALPSEWRQWLSGVRADVPSAEESAEVAQQTAQLQQVPRS